MLHDGTCISECPHGYYADTTGRCKVCHVSCASCSGPAAAHCTACVHPQVLRQGHCLPSCGGGFYPDSGTCEGMVAPLSSIVVKNKGLGFPVHAWISKSTAFPLFHLKWPQTHYGLCHLYLLSSGSTTQNPTTC